MDNSENILRVLELYSGIGGMHWALKESNVNFEIVLAVDINTTANQIYQHNFPSTCLQSFGLEKLTLHKLEALNINTILMSPPCQPFTRVGKKGDCEDVRTKSFLHILELLREMKNKPVYILVENVKGFEVSQTRGKLLECLNDCGYTHKEFLLTPLQFGIPNCRLRYYMIAKWKKTFFFESQMQVLTALPKAANNSSRTVEGCASCDMEDQDSMPCYACQNNSSSHHILNNAQGFDPASLGVNHQNVNFLLLQTEANRSQLSSINSTYSNFSVDATKVVNMCADSNTNSSTERIHQLKEAGRNMRYCEEEDEYVNENSLPLSHFMEARSFEDLREHWLSDKDLRLFVVMDIVFPALKKSTCFTKRYGHYVEGAGSIVQMSTNAKDVQGASEFKSQVVELKNKSEWGEEELSLLRNLKLRYFTPREVANLLCFPSQFDFPDGLSHVQKYRVLGNSLNVHVVSELIKVMTS